MAAKKVNIISASYENPDGFKGSAGKWELKKIELAMGDEFQIIAGHQIAAEIRAYNYSWEQMVHPDLLEKAAKELEMEAEANARLIVMSKEIAKELQQILKLFDSDAEGMPMYKWYSEDELKRIVKTAKSKLKIAGLL